MSVNIKFTNSTELFEHLIENFFRVMLCIHKLCEIVFFQTRSIGLEIFVGTIKAFRDSSPNLRLPNE